MSKLLIVALLACVVIAFAGSAQQKKDEHKQNYNQLHKEGYFGGKRGDDEGTKAHEKELHGKEAHEAGAAKHKTADRLSNKYREKQEEVPNKLAEHKLPIGIDRESAQDKVNDKLGKFTDYTKKVGDFGGKINQFKGNTWGVGGYAEKAEGKYEGKSGDIGKLSEHGESASKKAGGFEVDQEGGYEQKFQDDRDSYDVPSRKATPYDSKGKEKDVRGDKEGLPSQIRNQFHGIEQQKLLKKSPPHHEERLEELEKKFGEVAAKARERKDVGPQHGKGGKEEKGKKGKSYQ